jgi:phosphinothricin acetyltransferase
MRLRPARAADAATIAAIWNPQIRDTAVTFNSREKTAAGMAEEIVARQAAGHAFLVAEDAGGPAGFATYFQFRGGPGYARTMEHTVVLGPAARGRGMGRALVTALEDHARAAGAHSMIAGVSGENPAGVAFHERLGYARIALLPEVGWKFGRWMDLIVLQKVLEAR